MATSCSPIRNLNDDEILIRKVEVSGVKGSIGSTAREGVKTKPNTRVLMVSRFYLWAWNIGNDMGGGKFSRFLTDKVGEEPALLDSAVLNDDREYLNKFLFHKGLYNNEVNYTVSVKRKQARVKFTITPHDQYRVREMRYKAHDKKIFRILEADTTGRLIRSGMNYDSEILAAERNRVTGVLRNRGYFFFAPEFIEYKIDSTIEGQWVDINLIVRNPGLYQEHELFVITDVSINIDMPEGWRIYYQDTVGEEVFPEARYHGHGFPIRSNTILRTLQYYPGKLFRAEDVASTYSRLASLSIFSLVNQRFERDTLVSDSLKEIGFGGLKSTISLVPRKRHGYTIEPQFISSDRANTIDNPDIRNYGIGGIFTYSNRNAFKGGESFELSYRISLETQLQQADTIPFFSVVQHNISATVFVPRLWLFKKWLEKPENQRPRSSVGLGFIYESNFDFIRRVVSLNNSYTFSRGFTNWTFTPYEASYNTTIPKRNFFADLNPIDSIYIANQFATQYIGNIRAIFTRNTGRDPSVRNYSFIRILAEEAGTLQHILWQLTGQTQNAGGQYTIFGVPYQNYLKFDVDYRKGIALSPSTQTAFRLHGGYGRAFGNSEVVPYVRRYFAGGVNSLRGWRQGALGPGAFQPEPGSTPERSGEMILEASTEYRFRLISKLINLAVFGDAGNVWYTGEDPLREGVEFKFPRSLRDIGINTGLGLRIDMSFFIVRFDYGVPIYDPAQDIGNRWVLNSWFNSAYVGKNGVLNFAIGYPF